MAYRKTRGGTIIKYVPKDHPHYDPYWEYIIKPPHHNGIKIGEGGRRTYRRAWCVAMLYDRVENFKITGDRRTVPIEIINEGKSAIAAYLHTVHGWERGEVAEMMEVAPGTVDQYISNVVRAMR